MISKKATLALVLSGLLVLPYTTKVKAATSDELYAKAYNAVIQCQQEKTQETINIAREAIKNLNNTRAAFAIGEFSKLVDPVQQGLFEKFMSYIFTGGQPIPYESVSQHSINNARDLVNSFATCPDNKPYVSAWSSKLDEYQNYHINLAVNLLNTAKESKDIKDILIADKAIEDLASAKNNESVFNFASKLQVQVNTLLDASGFGKEIEAGVKLKSSLSKDEEYGVRIDATIVNNTKYTIVGYDGSAKLKDSDVRCHMESLATVLPGEESPIFTAQGPESGKASDVSFQVSSILIYDKDGNKIRIQYDSATQKYSYSYMENEAVSNPLIKVEQLPMSFEYSGPEELGTWLLNATYTNNSKLKVKSFKCELVDKTTNKLFYLNSNDEVLPGNKSTLITGIGPQDGKDSSYEVLKYTISVENEKNEETCIIYDAKLKLYIQY